MVDVSPVPKTVRASFPTVSEAEQASDTLRRNGFHINDIGWISSNDIKDTENISSPRSQTGFSDRLDTLDKVIAEAENVLAATDPSHAVGDVNPGMVNDGGYGRVTLTVSDDRYEPALEIIKQYGGQVF